MVKGKGLPTLSWKSVEGVGVIDTGAHSISGKCKSCWQIREDLEETESPEQEPNPAEQADFALPY